MLDLQVYASESAALPKFSFIKHYHIKPALCSVNEMSH